MQKPLVSVLMPVYNTKEEYLRQAIKSIFTDCVVDMQYEHLGSVILKIDNFKYEITTFRNEEYVKHRLKKVHYSKKFVDDIKRRDFTINALAMSLNQNVIDIVKGEKRLCRGVDIAWRLRYNYCCGAERPDVKYQYIREKKKK